ncbi:ABC transporter permease [Nocardioides sp. URHA0020]|uniref:ABC transporter permease n=1 Tax=Nocardioides sp. URHA0020 TaxID=1380392 RepID=UPI0006883FCB|nr:ABC transporter permease [Nocardioides sp. URHA0020]
MTDVTQPETTVPPRPIRHVDAPLKSPAATTGLLEVFRRRYLLRLLVRREISARYQGSFLGLLWSYINPLSQFFIYYVVIGVLFGLHQDVPNFAIHMFCGIIIVHFFTETFGAGTRSIVRNKSLVVKMALPREMFPVASMLVSGYHVLPQVVIMIVVCLLLGWTPTVGGLAALLLALLIIALVGTAMALLFSAANVFFRDIGNVAAILTNFVRFGVPMIYPYTMVQEKFGEYAQFYLLNPLADAVLLFQKAFWVGTTPDPAFYEEKHIPDNLWAYSGIAVVTGVVLLVIGQLVFTRLENKIPERL